MEDFLTKLTENALNSQAIKEFQEAISYFRKIEEVLEDSATYGSGSFEFVLFVLHNLAFCYQQGGETAECASYLDACAYNVTTRLKSSPRLSASLKAQYRLYLAQTYLQLSTLLSSLSKPDLAQKRCDSALKHLRSLVRLYYRVATPALSPGGKNRLGLPQKMSFVGVVGPCLGRVVQAMDVKSEYRQQRKTMMESVLTRPSSWSDITQLKGMPLDHWSAGTSLHEQVNLDSICLALSLAAGTLYLESTLKRAAGSSEAKRHHWRAVLIAEEMTDNALTQMITKTYRNTYGGLDVSTESVKSNLSRPSSRSPIRKPSSKSPAKPSKINRARSLAPSSALKPLPKELVSFPVACGELERRLREVQGKVGSPSLPAL